MTKTHHTALAVVALLAAPLGAWPTDDHRAPQTTPSVQMTQDQQRLLLRVWELLDLSADGVPDPEIAGRLHDIAERDVRPVYEVYAGLNTREFEGPEVDFAKRQRLLARALLGVPADDLLGFMTEAHAEGSVSEARLRSIELLAASQSHLSVQVLLELLEGLDPLELASTRTAERVSTSLSTSLGRHRAALRRVMKDPSALSPHLLPHLVSAAPLGSDGAELLVELLGLDPQLDTKVLVRLREFASTPLGFGSGSIQGRVSQAVRERLSHPMSTVREHALLALGSLVEPDAILQSIELLEDPDAAVRRAAALSLKQATGMHFGADMGRWYAWYDEQIAWYREHGVDAERQLLACSDAEAIAIIRDLVYRPLFRHRITEMLSPLLFRENNFVVNAATTAMKQLDSQVAVQYLIEGLSQADPACRQVIHQTLVEISGLELPPHQGEWLGAFSGVTE